jgi:uncharacterized RDD family membrane protein YckC
MTCTVCGKPHPCAHSRRKTAALLERDLSSSAAATAASSAPTRFSATEALDRAERERWRREVISRVRQHRARRGRFDPNASLELEFPVEDVSIAEGVVGLEHEPGFFPQDDTGSVVPDTGLGQSSSRPRPPKIIRFPRQSTLEAAGASRSTEDFELADPVLDAPRILDEPETAPVAEQLDMLECFADIQLEPLQPGENDEPLPPQPAPLWQRGLSGLMDACIVLVAAMMFAATFVKLAEVVPASRLAGLCALGVGTTIWLVFQYVFLVYGRGTPGMRALRLELRNFAGESASRFRRRCRALATVLSGLSLGLGFAWSFVDEDTLGWHDRISGTYLRSSHQQSAVSSQST